MDDNSILLSKSVDSFLDAPDTKVKAKIIERPVDEENVCVIFHKKDKALYGLTEDFKNMCAIAQRKTVTHRYALCVVSPGGSTTTRLGYCDALTANSLLFRICLNADVEFSIYRDFGYPERQRELHVSELNRRSFRF